MRVTPDRYGVICNAKTVAGVGLTEWQKASRHLADDWSAVRVAVTQTKPGKIRIRAVRVDPLAEPTTYDPDPEQHQAPADLRMIEVGLDEYAEPVSLRLEGVSGVCVCGLPGYGKTSFFNNLITRLSPSPRVLFIGLDGKTDDPEQGDFGEVADRFTLLRGDDLEEANELLRQLCEFGRARSRSIRLVMGRKNIWHAEGPTPDWPLIVLIIDEAHTFFEQVKDGGDKELRRRNALAAQNAMYVQELIKKRRAVGIVTFLATQKGTGDAIPTFIRDVCSVSLAFACRTIEAAVAALGDDIRQYPEANPVALQDPVYIGVASMAVQGRPGFTRVRMPYVPDATAAAVAIRHREIVTARNELPPVPVPAAAIGSHLDDDEDDQ
jgi:S-DNA-T family DNA segregation ATPase FtsK/SpoIIIE